MLPSLRRKNQKLSDEEVQAVIARNTHGVLALAGDDGYPYALPISYAYADAHSISIARRRGTRSMPSRAAARRRLRSSTPTKSMGPDTRRTSAA